MRLIAAVAKVSDVFFVGHIGLRDECHTGRNDRDYIPQEFDDFVRLLKVNAPCSRLVPEIRDGIEPEDICAMADI